MTELEIAQMMPRAAAWDTGRPASAAMPPWKVLVIDDEEDVHGVTRLVLSGFSFDGRDIELLHAYSGAEAMAIFGREPDIAVALVDVVMETELAGLDVVNYVRETLGNRFIRLILRTGHPGSAPEREVIVRYDINDYKAKTELSSLKLYSAMMTALRSYRDIMDIEAQRIATARVLDVATILFRARSVSEFAVLALEGVQELLVGDGKAGFYCDDRIGMMTGRKMLSSRGSPERFDGQALDWLGPHLATIADCDFTENLMIVRLACRLADAHFICTELERAPTALDRLVIKLFHLYATSALDNLLLLEQNQHAQRQAIRALAKLAPYRYLGAAKASTLPRAIIDQTNLIAAGRRASIADFLEFLRLLAIQAEVGEWDSKGAVRHVEQVGRLACKLADLAGMSRDFCDAITLAGEMHDVGKIFVPPSGSSGWFEPDGETRIRAVEHAIWGAEFLRGVSHHASEAVRMAAGVALYHHEMWNGHGYPQGKAGTAIPIAARIVAIVDFFDLCIGPKLDVAYRMIAHDEAFDLVSTAAGTYFDPDLAKLFSSRRRDFAYLL